MSNKRGFLVRRLIAGLGLGFVGAPSATEAADRNADRRKPGKKVVRPHPLDDPGRPAAPLLSILPPTPRCW